MVPCSSRLVWSRSPPPPRSRTPAPGPLAPRCLRRSFLRQSSDHSVFTCGTPCALRPLSPRSQVCEVDPASPVFLMGKLRLREVKSLTKRNTPHNWRGFSFPSFRKMPPSVLGTDPCVGSQPLPRWPPGYFLQVRHVGAAGHSGTPARSRSFLNVSCGPEAQTRPVGEVCVLGSGHLDTAHCSRPSAPPQRRRLKGRVPSSSG